MSDASRQRAKAVEVPEFSAVPIELRHEPTTSPASDRSENEPAVKRIFGRALVAAEKLLKHGEEQ
eukprot:567211-Pleurochrysis_carterae.AAC.1